MKKAIITGITGQDGSYLVELLLNKGYEVHGLVRRASTFNTHRINHLYMDPIQAPDIKMLFHYGDLTDPGLLTELIYNVHPDEIYHLGAQSHVKISFDMPEFTGDVTGLGTTRILEAIRRSGIKTKFYQASSSELYGSSKPPQSETTPFHPQSPYAVAKLYSYWMTVNYRNGYNLFASNGILFNHESPRRGETFVTRKITRAIAAILTGRQKRLFLGNIDARRDWGFAAEYVDVMWQILQLDSPDDFVVGTGMSHSVREFIQNAFEYVGIELEWFGTGLDEKGVIKSLDHRWSNILSVGNYIVEIDQRYFRPTEVDYLEADLTKAKSILNWEPKISFDELIQIMMDADLIANGITPPGLGLSNVRNKGFTWTTLT